MNLASRDPIEYFDHVDIRFADLDYYGHVNSKHYVDLVSTARLNFMAQTMNMSISEVTKRGIGFFLTKSTIHYKRPINGLQKVAVASFVQELREERVLVIPFTISSVSREKLLSDGELEFALIDMATQRSTKAPDWILDLFFKPAL